MRTHLLPLLLAVAVAPVASAQSAARRSSGSASAPGTTGPAPLGGPGTNAPPANPQASGPSAPPAYTTDPPSDQSTPPQGAPPAANAEQDGTPEVHPRSSNPLAPERPAPEEPIAQPSPELDEAKARQLLTPDPRTQELISGAPLRDPNVKVHIVQRKQFDERGRLELALYPAAFQTNVKFTDHVGSAASLTWHLHENFGLQLLGQYNWINEESGFNRELIDKVREEAQAATSLLLTWAALGGVEVTPLYGKFAFYQGVLVHFQVLFNGGVGLGGTRHELRPSVGDLSPSFGDTGTKMLGSVGAGLRFQVGDRFSLRLEVRDLVYTARVDKVNGCSADDLAALSQPIASGSTDLSGVPVSSGCRVSAFQGTDPKTGESRAYDVPLAQGLVMVPTSDVLNNIGLYAGVSVVF